MKTKQEELKTLKDLELEAMNEDGEMDEYAEISDLRQEAIKWIKYYQFGHADLALKFAISEWIRNFFNITEEDLK